MSEPTLRAQIARVVLSSMHEPAKIIEARLANLMIREIDGVFVKHWSHMSDMGVPRKVFDKIKKQVKKRL